MPTEPTPPAEVLMRPTSVEDADTLADLFLRARDAAFPAIPRPVHPPESVRAWVRRWYDAGPGGTPAEEAWIAEEDGVVVGFLMLEQDWVHSLYVEPGLTGRGVGAALLDLAKALRPRGLGLWVFESNEGARRFYARNGFVEVRRTDGSDNEERAPDVEMRWRPPEDLPRLRERIDEVDDELAALLAARAELTAAIQRVKALPGPAGRDPDREREIARRMAEVAPALGEERLARIMHVVITESLDAAAE